MSVDTLFHAWVHVSSEETICIASQPQTLQAEAPRSPRPSVKTSERIWKQAEWEDEWHREESQWISGEMKVGFLSEVLSGSHVTSLSAVIYDLRSPPLVDASMSSCVSGCFLVCRYYKQAGAESVFWWNTIPCARSWNMSMMLNLSFMLIRARAGCSQMFSGQPVIKNSSGLMSKLWLSVHVCVYGDDHAPRVWILWRQTLLLLFHMRLSEVYCVYHDISHPSCCVLWQWAVLSRLGMSRKEGWKSILLISA